MWIDIVLNSKIMFAHLEMCLNGEYNFLIKIQVSCYMQFGKTGGTTTIR